MVVLTALCLLRSPLTARDLFFSRTLLFVHFFHHILQHFPLFLRRTSPEQGSILLCLEAQRLGDALPSIVSGTDTSPLVKLLSRVCWGVLIGRHCMFSAGNCVFPRDGGTVVG